jgi:hypothetical protein
LLLTTLSLMLPLGLWVAKWSTKRGNSLVQEEEHFKKMEQNAKYQFIINCKVISIRNSAHR